MPDSLEAGHGGCWCSCRSVSFLHPEMGEFWYEIQLIADPAQPIQVCAQLSAACR